MTAARPNHLPRRTSLGLTGLARIESRTPDSASAEIAGDAIAEALRATTKLNMNMNKMSAWGIATPTSPEVMLALWLRRSNQIGRATSELQSLRQLVCRLLL